MNVQQSKIFEWKTPEIFWRVDTESIGSGSFPFLLTKKVGRRIFFGNSMLSLGPKFKHLSFGFDITRYYGAFLLEKQCNRMSILVKLNRKIFTFGVIGKVLVPTAMEFLMNWIFFRTGLSSFKFNSSKLYFPGMVIRSIKKNVEMLSNSRMVPAEFFGKKSTYYAKKGIFKEPSDFNGIWNRGFLGLKEYKKLLVQKRIKFLGLLLNKFVGIRVSRAYAALAKHDQFVVPKKIVKKKKLFKKK